MHTLRTSNTTEIVNTDYFVFIGEKKRKKFHEKQNK